MEELMITILSLPFVGAIATLGLDAFGQIRADKAGSALEDKP
jgi:hypothetical protein